MEVLNNFILIEPINRQDELETKIKGFEIKRSGPQGQPVIGYVRFMDKNLKVDFKIGDKVIFNEPHPDGFKHEGVGLIAVKEEQVLAVWI